jgi:diguanylate cyclase (GGDEF)-like protein/PAS domain S-box-containing protein
LLADHSSHFDLESEWLSGLPLRQDYYMSAVRLCIPGEGIILLLSPEPANPDVPFAHIFQPIMANLAKALRLCRNNEAYTQELIDARNEARADNLRFRSAMDTSSECIFLIDPEAMRFVDFNFTAEEVLGLNRGELLQLGPHDIKPENDREQLQSYFKTLLRDGNTGYGELNTDHITKSGQRFPVEIRLSTLPQADGEPLIIAVARDVTERKLVEESLFAEKERAQVTLHSIGDGVITTDPQGYVEYLNPIAEALTGWSTSEARSKALTQVFHIVDETSHEPIPNPVARCLSEGRIIGLANHTVLINRHGDEIAIEDSAAPIRDRQGHIVGVVLVFHDVSKARELAHELSWQASHDSLTNLINRSEFERRLEQAFKRTRESGETHTLFYLDLDQFKVVNDTCGHIAGDELLRQLASHMQRWVRESDTLARLGGDEFGVLLQNCSLQQAQRIADTLRDSIMEFSFTWEERTFKVGSSIGIVEINLTLQSTTQIMSNADVACYVAKEHGGNRSNMVQRDDLELSQRQGEMRWVSQINHALNNDHLILHAQAIYPLNGGAEEATHYELLLRMADEQGNLINPGTFLPAAERYKLMYTIDCWVINRALTLLAQHKIEDGNTVYTINLSGFSLTQDGLRDYIIEQFERTGVPPRNFCFEVTETAAISNLTRAHDLILELKSLGCAFALDDFGSGLSSFTYLKNLPVDYLKIDGSFIRDILHDTVDESMVSAINRIGHEMGLKTIAEYVENEATLNKLRELGVDYAQGYYLDKPCPLGEIYRSMSDKSRAIITASSRPSLDG